MSEMKAVPDKLAARLAVVVAATLLAACNTAPKDETAGMSNEQVYSEARDEASSGNYERAIKFYERLEGRAAGTLLSEQAQLELAHTYWKAGEKAQALATLDRFIKLHPSSPGMDYALYLRGLVNFNENLGLFGRLAGQDLSERDQQASKDSYQSFKQLVEQYPDSVYAADSRLRMNYIVNALAAYEVHVARYYFRRGAYLAAANRAQQAVQDFQESPSTEEALFIMMRCYERMGLPQLRQDAERVLARSYPQSKFLTQGEQQAKSKSWWILW